MKKILSLVFLLASLACSAYSYASASNPKVDLQIRNAYIRESLEGDPENPVKYLCIIVQNNGTDDFKGTFTVCVPKISASQQFKQEFTCEIDCGSTEFISFICSPTPDPYYIIVDYNDDVPETNEDNNMFYFVDGQAQTGITTNGLLARDFCDTLFVLPGEYVYQNFALSELNGQKKIIGFNFSSTTYILGKKQKYYMGINCPVFDDGSKSGEGEFDGGKYSYYFTNFGPSYKWMANSSASAKDFSHLASFSFVAKDMPVGMMTNIFINAYCATTDLKDYSENCPRTIKVVDRIRGDVNDDGIVDQKDLDLLIEGTSSDLINPYWNTKGRYKERGINYGAGMVVFEYPGFLDICLINIWVHDKNDPLVQGLGIGEMMSSRSSSAVKSIANTFSISGNELIIDAPGADVYNVTAQMSDGKTFQATGKIGEIVSIPDPNLKYNVETVALEQKMIVTEVLGTKADENLLSVFPTRFVDYVTVSGTGLLSVFNANGQIILSQELNGSGQIATSSWPSGLYIFKIISSDGRIQTVKALK